MSSIKQDLLKHAKNNEMQLLYQTVKNYTNTMDSSCDSTNDTDSVLELQTFLRTLSAHDVHKKQTSQSLDQKFIDFICPSQKASIHYNTFMQMIHVAINSDTPSDIIRCAFTHCWKSAVFSAFLLASLEKITRRSCTLTFETKSLWITSSS